MRISLLFLFSFLLLGATAQQLLPIQHDTNTYNQEFILNGVADFGTNSIYNEMGKKLIFGGYITNEMKDNSFAKHKGINRAGVDASAEFEYRNMKVNLFKKENLGFLVKGGYYNYGSVLYSKDLFGMVFYGNERYLGTNSDFSGTRFQGMSFQKVGFGVIDKKSKSNVTLNFYSITNYAEGNIRDGRLFQSASGDSLSLRLDGDLNYSSSSSDFKGYGVGVDLDFRLPVMLNEGKTSYIQFLAKNLGVAHLNTTITRYVTDTTYNFNGLTFDQLYGSTSIFNGNYSLLDTLGIDSISVTKIRFLPGYVQIGKMVDELNSARIQSFFGVRMYPSVSYVPMIYAGAQCKTTKWLDLGLNVSYGGYTSFRTGLYAQVKIKQCAIGIATEDVIGIVSEKGRGESLIVRLRVKL